MTVRYRDKSRVLIGLFLVLAAIALFVVRLRSWNSSEVLYSLILILPSMLILVTSFVSIVSKGAVKLLNLDDNDISSFPFTLFGKPSTFDTKHRIEWRSVTGISIYTGRGPDGEDSPIEKVVVTGWSEEGKNGCHRDTFTIPGSIPQIREIVKIMEANAPTAICWMTS